jgi:hypothetical protein
MPAKRLVPLVIAIAMVASAWLAAAAQAVPNRLIGLGALTNKNTLYGFSGADLNTVTVVPVTGLGVATLVGISFRPANGQLYGVGITGNTESVFAIDPSGGAATLVGSATPAVGTFAGTTAYGIDFNPVADRLRVVDGLESTGTNINNFRVNPNNAAIAGVDTKLDYSLLPGGEGSTRPLATIAYDRNVVGATASTVFGIVVGANDGLVRLGGVDGGTGPDSPNNGVLTQIGALGVDTTSNTGLDIDPATGEAYAVLQVAGASGLYRIDLATGAATLIGKIAGGAIAFGSLAIVPPPPTSPETPPASSSPPPSAPPPSGPPAPVLHSLTIKPYALGVAASGGPIAARKVAGGTKVSYTLSATTTVKFVVEKAIPSKRGWFRLLKPTFAHSGQVGANGFRFSGRLGGKALAPGRYRLTGRVGTSSRSATFKVLEPPR